MKGLRIALIAILFVFCGMLIEKYEVITEPAYWALYGAFFGSINMIVWIGEDDGQD